MSLSSFDAPLFDAYLIVDWSAAKQPTTGPDSIWWALARRDDRSVAVAETANPPTRAEAARQLASTLAGEFAEGRRVLVGFDFPFGYAAGTAARLGGEEADWKTIWTVIDELLEDGEDNANNRFPRRGELNVDLTGLRPFRSLATIGARRRTRTFVLPQTAGRTECQRSR